MTRGFFKICTLLLVLFLAAPPAFCIHCCCTADEPLPAASEASHSCCTKPKQQDDSIPTLAAKAACDCPDLYEPMLAVASAAAADSDDSSRTLIAALVVDSITVARPWTDGRTLRPTPPPEVERRPYASLPARAPPAVTVC